MNMTIFCSRLWLSRAFSSLSSNPLHMLKAHQEAEVDILDRMPNPVGLVCSGVAPDHLETKVNVSWKWESRVICVTKRASRCVSRGELCDMLYFPEVVFAFGAESDRVFGVPGENLEGIYSARELTDIV
ncbi:NADPH:adrenodoxin oxidoreductase mitochondrial [Bienertia sinuspersici]